MKKHNPDRDLIILLLSLIVPLLGDEMGETFQRLLARILEGGSEPLRIHGLDPETEEVPEVPLQTDGGPIKPPKPPKPKKDKAPKRAKRVWSKADHKAQRPTWRQAGAGPCEVCGEDVIRFQPGGCPPSGWTCEGCKAKKAEGKAEKAKPEAKPEPKFEGERPDKGPGSLCRCCGKEIGPEAAWNRQNHESCYKDLRSKARALRLKAEEAGVPLSSKESEDLARRSLWPEIHKE